MSLVLFPTNQATIKLIHTAAVTATTRKILSQFYYNYSVKSLPPGSTGNKYINLLHNQKNNDNDDHSMWMFRHDAGEQWETILIWSGL